MSREDSENTRMYGEDHGGWYLEKQGESIADGGNKLCVVAAALLDALAIAHVEVQSERLLDR